MSSEIKTISQLEQAITLEYKQRRSLINTYFSYISEKQHQGDNREQQNLRYTFITVLYAHWEGFVKVALDFYISYVSNFNCTLNELTPNFQVLALQKVFSDTSFDGKLTLITTIKNETIREHNIKSLPYLNNLNSEILNKILQETGIPNHYANDATTIKWLVDNRNHLAHGNIRNIKASDLTYERVEVNKGRILKIIDSIKTDIINSASTKSFLQNPW